MNILFVILLILAQPLNAISFKDLSYGELNIELNALNGSFAMVSTAEESYDLPQAKEGNIKCSPTIVRVTDRETLSEDVLRPQIIISGAIHGDERVGPQASLFTSQLLVWSAMCEIKKSKFHCDLLKLNNVLKNERIWLAYLATRRDTYVIPAANCIGYAMNRRNDANNVDPNRDFPYSRQDKNCLQSNTAKLFFIIMSLSLIQIVVTFHGGMVAIGYEWGSLNHLSPSDKSPDDTINAEIGHQLVSYGGSFKNEPVYPIGRINSIVYPVDGGMEDWMYAAGWDQSSVKNCKAFTPSQYVREGITPSDKGGNRAIVYLVETSDSKRPNDASLGGSESPLDKNSSKSGHISRNARVALVSIDVAMPYNCIQSLNVNNNMKSDSKNGDNLKGIKSRRIDNLDKNEDMNSSTSDNTTDTKKHSSGDYDLNLKWYVGGAVDVDATWISIHIPPNPSHSSTDYSILSHLLEALEPSVRIPPFAPQDHKEASSNLNNQNFKNRKTKKKRIRDRILEENYGKENKNLKYDSTNKFGVNKKRKRILNHKISDDDRIRAVARTHLSYAQKGRGRWARNSDPLNPEIFSTTIKISSNTNNSTFSPGDEYKSFDIGVYWLVAWSMVDSGWGSSKQGHGSENPQSHLANGRTSINWTSMSNKDFRINEIHHNLNSKKPYIRHRLIKGRKYWPSDPIIIEVLSSGEIAVVSSVLQCAHWDRIIINNNISSKTENEKFEKYKISETVTNQNYLFENVSYNECYIVFFIVISIGFAILLFRFMRSLFYNTGNRKSSNTDIDLHGKYSKVRQNGV